MSNVADVHVFSVNLGTQVASGTIPVMYVPTYGGGITLLDCNLVADGAGTTPHAKLITLQNLTAGALVGTEVALATIATATTDGHIVSKMASAAPLTIVTPFVGTGTWIAYQGTAAAGGTAQMTLYLSYVMGKG